MSNVAVREATVRAVLMGVGFGAVFGAANAYLGLRVGAPEGCEFRGFQHGDRLAQGVVIIRSEEYSYALSAARDLKALMGISCLLHEP